MANDYVIAPNSDIYLIKCPLEIDSLNQISFVNESAQNTYFYNLPHLLMENATYMRKDGRLYFDEDFDTCLTYNYCMYKNESYSNKWFYAFVTDLRFESNNSCSCQLKTDVFQTWMFDYTLKKSFIERSHVAKSSDTVGAYTVPESLELGEYKVYTHNAYADTYADSIVLGSTVAFDDGSSVVGNLVYISGTYTGMPAGCGYYRYSIASNQVSQAVQRLNQLGATDAIVAMFMFPSAWAPTETGTQYPNRVQTSTTPVSYSKYIDRIASLDGYIPKNAKCLTYPYCYIVMSNGVGTANTYRQEVWSLNSNNKMVVNIDVVLCPGGSAKVYPFQYNGSNNNYDEGFTLGKYPEVSYPIDVYTNWQVQNGSNFFGTPMTATETGLLGNTINAVQNLANGNVEEAGGALRGIWNTMQEQYRHSLVPPSVGGNINAGDVSAVTGAMGLHIQTCGIKQEFARNIDNFFEMFGYKLNSVAIPNTSSRSNWNYIKTIDVNITGNIPTQDMQELKALYNNGFTIWHTTTYFMDYSQTNS